MIIHHLDTEHFIVVRTVLVRPARMPACLIHNERQQTLKPQKMWPKGMGTMEECGQVAGTGSCKQFKPIHDG